MFLSKLSPKAHALSGTAIAICLAFTLATGNALAQDIEDAIVKVESTINGQKYDGIGFAWQPAGANSAYIVTALHLVAGSSAIAIRSPENVKLAGARIHKFVRNADLALLAPANRLGISALPVYPDSRMPPRGDLWSVSKQNVVSNKMRLGRQKELFALFKRKRSGNKPMPPLKRQDVSKHFNPHNYPGIGFRILALKEPVGAGNSGSPITYRGAAISMVDGGLQNLGGIKKAWWSIPLKKNLTLLWNQGETNAAALKPYTRENGRILFSKPRDQNKRMFSGESGIELYLTDELIFEDVYDSMLPEDQAFVTEVIDDDAEFDFDDLLDEEIDVYEEYNTGATFAIPAMLSDDLILENHDGLTFVEAFSKFSDNKSFVKLIVMIGTNGMDGRDAFEDYILDGEALTDWDTDEWPEVEWHTDDESDDDIIDDLDNTDEPYYFEIMERIYEQFDDDGNLINDGEVYASMTIEGNNFIGVAIIVNDPSGLEGDDLMNYYLMEVCVTMAGFPY